MIFFPKKMETINDVIKAIAALKEMNWNKPAPGKLIESK
jgi:hypothetical protein